MKTQKILLVDDEPQLCYTIQKFLGNHGYDVVEAGSCQAALQSIERHSPDAIILDYSLPDGNSLSLIRQLREVLPESPIIVLTGHGTIELAVAAMKEGAEHFLTKPVQLPILKLTIEREIENQRNRQKVRASEARHRNEPNPFVGVSEAVRSLENLARRVVQSDRPVLIQGETGTGKGVLANWLHSAGPRSKEPFVDVNCAGLSRELLESELFGYEKGAFTGAESSKIGLLEAAHKGSIFLDEIGDAELSVQSKLLKALEEKKIRRLGDVRDRKVDVRMIAATHKNLQTAVVDKTFREDLYYRISVVVLEVPPLRWRGDDIELLAQRLLEGFSRELGRDPVALSRESVEALRQYTWPGNIRELRNVLDRALLVNDGNVIRPADLLFGTPQAHRQAAAGAPADSVTEMERQHIQRILTEEDGNIPRASKRLGIPRSSLYKKIKKFEDAR